ncbi:MAG: flagellar biosynthesis protein FlhF [Steroidobacteraceae bacterium]|jgi:flagellar biosynthesis protein FlhF
MKIKRYTAASMRSALDQVRIEQGPEAVILSSRRIPEGIEVIAAVDYDETLMHDARVHRAPPSPPATTISVAPPPAPVPAAAKPQAAPKPMPPKAASARTEPAAPQRGVRAFVPPRASMPTARPTVAATAATAATAVAPAPVAAQPAAPRPLAPAQAAPHAPATRAVAAAPQRTAADSGYIAMRDELQDLRHLVERELASLTWNDKRLREPLKVRVLEELSSLDIAPDMAMKLASLTPKSTRLQNPSHIPIALLAKHLPVIADPTCIKGGVVAIVGPTGVGKTTTIAKLAARWCMLHGADDLALVSTDSYRIGAREQLLTYARILGVPMYAANSGKELAQVLERLKSKKLTLIDTAGMGPRDARLHEQLSALRQGAANARVLLALPAQGEGHALEEITTAFSALSPVACILTKVDEAASLGAAMSTALRHKLPIAYLCNGQRVPEDLHEAQSRRVWLVRAAMRLRERAPPRRDEAYLARHFGRGQAHA